MARRFNPPPNWPSPPAGWTPPAGWQPDASWGPAPPGWQLWVEDPYARVPLPVPHTPARSSGPAMIAVALFSCGLAGFVPPLLAARQRRDDPAFSKKMYIAAAALGGLTLLGTLLLGAADTNEAGDTTGVLGTLGSTVLFINLVLAVTLAVLIRDSDTGPKLPAAPPEPPGVAEARARRQLREQYRKIATDDPSLARSMHIGRPDVARSIDDGGLVNWNAVSAEALETYAGLTAAEATRVATARETLGRFTSIEEAAVYAELPDATVTMLREQALFY